MVTLFEASSAFTVILNDVPAGVLLTAVSENWAAAPALTAIGLDVPVNEPLIVVMVWLPAVFRVTENVPVPFVNVESGGSTAWTSLLVN